MQRTTYFEQEDIDMAKSVIAGRKPAGVQLESGKSYYWCACGRSKNQPFCDGSHKGTGIEPRRFKADRDGEAFLCMCKQTGNPPYCDGTHASLPEEEETGDEEGEPGNSNSPEPTLGRIQELAKNGISQIGKHG